MIFKISLLFLFVTVAWGRKIAFKDCGAGEIEWVDVTPCDAEPCIFKKGEKVTLTAAGKSSHDSKGGTLKVTVELAGIEVEYPGIEPNVCKIEGVDCPIVKGKHYELKYTLEAKSYFPALSTIMKWKVTGDDGNILLCASARVGIKD